MPNRRSRTAGAQRVRSSDWLDDPSRAYRDTLKPVDDGAPLISKRLRFGEREIHDTPPVTILFAMLREKGTPIGSVARAEKFVELQLAKDKKGRRFGADRRNVNEDPRRD